MRNKFIKLLNDFWEAEAHWLHAKATILWMISSSYFFFGVTCTNKCMQNMKTHWKFRFTHYKYNVNNSKVLFQNELAWTHLIFFENKIRLLTTFWPMAKSWERYRQTKKQLQSHTQIELIVFEPWDAQFSRIPYHTVNNDFIDGRPSFSHWSLTGLTQTTHHFTNQMNDFINEPRK